MELLIRRRNLMFKDHYEVLFGCLSFDEITNKEPGVRVNLKIVKRPRTRIIACPVGVSKLGRGIEISMHSRSTCRVICYDCCTEHIFVALKVCALLSFIAPQEFFFPKMPTILTSPRIRIGIYGLVWFGSVQLESIQPFFRLLL